MEATRSTREGDLEARYERSRELYERACRVIPGGIHLSGRPLVDTMTTPMYFERGTGSRIHDVDGHAYTDYLMGFGAQVLGYARPEVDQAAQRPRRRRSVSVSLPSRLPQRGGTSQLAT